VGLETPPYVPVTPSLFDKAEEVSRLARFSNVALKFSGVPALSGEEYPFSDVWDPLRPLLSEFGTERLLWGSDFTRCRELHNYRESVDFLTFSPYFDQASKRRMFSENLRSWVPAADGLGGG
jgi:predicted TIM-barrel fold metal-dependent hydrolase